MDVSSVSSPNNALLHSTQQSERQVQARNDEAQKAAEESSRTRQTQEQKVEQAAPVVNTQGQTTGRLVNTEA